MTDRKPDNLVALHYQETGSYVVDASPLESNPLDKWALNRILEQKDRIEALETVVKVFRNCVETRMFPAKDSPCYDMVIELVGERDDE